MDKRKDVDFCAEDVTKTRKNYEDWKERSSTSEPEVVGAFIAALECHNDALAAYSIQLRRKLRRANTAKNGVK